MNTDQLRKELKAETAKENILKQQVNQYLFDIRKQVSRKAYWNATKLTHDLFELLENQPYVEENNPPTEATQERKDS